MAGYCAWALAGPRSRKVRGLNAIMEAMVRLNRGRSAVTAVTGGCKNAMNIVEYFEMRKREVEEQLEAIESGRVLRIVCETKAGPLDVTDQEKQRLRQASKDYWRAAENLRRIHSS